MRQRIRTILVFEPNFVKIEEYKQNKFLFKKLICYFFIPRRDATSRDVTSSNPNFQCLWSLKNYSTASIDCIFSIDRRRLVTLKESSKSLRNQSRASQMISAFFKYYFYLMDCIKHVGCCMKLLFIWSIFAIANFGTKIVFLDARKKSEFRSKTSFDIFMLFDM